MVFPEQAEGILITEKFRGIGANLVNVDGEQFVFEREPRDVEAACIIRECIETNKGVPTPTGKRRRLARLADDRRDARRGNRRRRSSPASTSMFKRFGIDISQGAHAHLPHAALPERRPGVQVHGELTVPGLFVAGEVGGGVHGENRLMGNSLLDIMVYGRSLAPPPAASPRTRPWSGKLSLDHVAAYNAQVTELGIDPARIAPLLLPDYTGEHVKKKQLTTVYQGSLR